jgi:hypothetical protein
MVLELLHAYKQLDRLGVMNERIFTNFRCVRAPLPKMLRETHAMKTTPCHTAHMLHQLVCVIVNHISNNIFLSSAIYPPLLQHIV